MNRPVSDADRRDLHEAPERELGPGPATTLMELLPPFGWSGHIASMIVAAKLA